MRLRSRDHQASHLCTWRPRRTRARFLDDKRSIHICVTLERLKFLGGYKTSGGYRDRGEKGTPYTELGVEGEQTWEPRKVSRSGQDLDTLKAYLGNESIIIIIMKIKISRSIRN